MIKIGVIGSTESEKRIKHVIKKFPTFHPTFISSDNIYDAPEITEQLSRKVDVLLYSGLIPYSICKQSIPAHIPAHYIPLKGESLYRGMYRLKSKVNRIRAISVDTLTDYDMSDLNSQLDESIASFYFNANVSLTNADAVVQFHKRLYQENRTECALTGLKIVSDQLTELGIPNEWILPTDGDVIVSLERALLSTEQRKKLESQIVFGIIHIDNFEQLMRQITSEPKNQRLQLDIQRGILDYIESLDGFLTALGSNEYMFVTTRGTFERVSQGYKYFPLIMDIKKQYKVNISVGIGFGVTANEAGTHARMALLQSFDHGGKKCFIVKEDRSVIGPIENNIPLTYPLSVTDKDIGQDGKHAQISPYYLGKVISILNRKKTKTFTANELASSLGITVRSANRMLVNWMDTNIIEIAGYEKLHTRGRPRHMYRLLVHEI